MAWRSSPLNIRGLYPAIGYDKVASVTTLSQPYHDFCHLRRLNFCIEEFNAMDILDFRTV
jgi:hypothetical protein